MRTPSLAIFLSLMAVWATAMTAQGAEDRVRVHEQTYKVKPGSDLRVRAARGSIRVEGAEGGDEVRMRVEAKAVRGSDAKALELLDQHEVEFRQVDGTVELETRLPRQQIWSLWGANLEVEITITVPRECNVDAVTSGGGIDLSRVRGQVDVRTSGGSLRFNGVTGPVKGRTSGGSIKAQSIAGAADLQTSGGSISVEDIRQGPVSLSTSGGSISATAIEGPAVLRTSGGSIRAKNEGRGLEASTSGGSIDVEIVGAPQEPVVLRTSGGGISLTLASTASVMLDATTSGGSVRNDFPEPRTNDKNRNVLRGAIGSGGPEVKLRTSGGGIHIRRR